MYPIHLDTVSEIIFDDDSDSADAWQTRCRCSPKRDWRVGEDFRDEKSSTTQPSPAGCCIVGRSPTFAYWRKVGYQTRTVFVQAATGIAVQSECSISMRAIIT